MQDTKNIPCPTLADIHLSIRALTSLDLSCNELSAEGAKHVAEAIKVNVSALRFH